MRTERLKRVADVRVSNVDKKSTDGEAPVRLCNYTDVYYNERITSALDFMAATATPEQRVTFGLRQGDVVLTKDSETADDISVCALVAEDIPELVCGYHLAVVRARPAIADGSYLRWVIASDASRQAMSSAATGVTRFGLRREAIADLEVPLPPFDEQRAIADYLDRETARIDALVAAKERLIALVEERWQTGVDAATRSALIIDRTAELPGGWTMTTLRRCIAHSDYGIGSPTEREGVFPVLGMANVQAGEIVGPRGGFVNDVDSSLLLAEDDLLFNRTNSRELVGKVGIVRALQQPTTFASYLVRLRPNRSAAASYLNYLLNSREMLGVARSLALPSIGQANLNPNRYCEIRVPLPPLREQIVLSSALDVERDRVTSVRNAIGRQLSLLRERRQTLITAALSGQVEVAVAA